MCPTLGNPVDCSRPGSSVHGILQARILEWGATSFCKRREGIPSFWTSGLARPQYWPRPYAGPALILPPGPSPLCPQHSCLECTWSGSGCDGFSSVGCSPELPQPPVSNMSGGPSPVPGANLDPAEVGCAQLWDPERLPPFRFPGCPVSCSHVWNPSKSKVLLSTVLGRHLQGSGSPELPPQHPHPRSGLRAGKPSPTSKHRHSVHRDNSVKTKNCGWWLTAGQ